MFSQILIYLSAKSLANNRILMPLLNCFWIGRYESPLYPHVIYNNYNNAVLHLKSDNTVDYLKYGAGSINKEYKNKVDVIDYIKKNHSGIVRNIENPKMLKTNNINNLVLNSEYIAIIKPKKVEYKNQFAQLVQCKVTMNYKNKLQEDVIITLPAGAELGKEYAVLLNKVDAGSYTVSSRYSFISKEDEKSFGKLLKSMKDNKIIQ